MVSVSSIIASWVLHQAVLKNSWIYLCRDNSSISAKPCMRTLLTVEERPWASAGWQYPHQPCTRGSQVIFYYWTDTSIQFTLIFSFNTWGMGLMNSTDKHKPSILLKLDQPNIQPIAVYTFRGYAFFFHIQVKRSRFSRFTHITFNHIFHYW